MPQTQVPVLSFIGAAGTVTGSRFLIETADARVLVDCGLFQGLKELRLRNWAPFPVEPSSIDAVVLTHGHVDHCAYLPALVRDGFKGQVHVTATTADLAAIVLPDSGRLNEEEANYANRKGFSKHHPALPLFTERDAVASLGSLRPAPFLQPVDVAPGVSVTMQHGGHILGSASVLLELDGREPRRVVFSGDLGRQTHPVLQPPDPRPRADAVVCESTYGDRLHDDEADPVEQLAEAVRRTAQRGGVVIIPAFAVDRTEVLLFHLRALFRSGAVPEIPIYLDSPMASAALAVYRRAALDGASEIRPALHGTDPFAVPGLHEVRDVAGSKSLNTLRGPMIIISASGMLTGGRVLHHVSRRLGDDRNTIVLIGYQAAGTRGRSLLEGAHELKMLGRYWPVRAEIAHIPGFSVHADRDELIDWLRSGPDAPETVYAVHGELTSSQAFAASVEERLGWTAVVPRHGERVRLD